MNEFDVGVLILTVRGQRVILSSDLAAIYGVPAKALNQAVARNRKRFPRDFAFRINWQEVVAVQRSRSQFVTLKRGHNVKHRPMAFTEHGAIMAASVLNSSKAVQMSVFVVRAFLRIRDMIANQTELVSRLDQLERRVGSQDRDIAGIIQTIRQLVAPRLPEAKRIGFRRETSSTPPGRPDLKVRPTYCPSACRSSERRAAVRDRAGMHRRDRAPHDR